MLAYHTAGKLRWRSQLLLDLIDCFHAGVLWEMSVLLLLDRKTSVLDCCGYDQLLEQIWSQKVTKENLHVPLEIRASFLFFSI